MTSQALAGSHQHATRLPPRRAWPAGLIVFGLAMAVRSPFMWSPGFAIDQGQFVAWSEKGRSAGLAAVYARKTDGSGKRWCNYPPAYLYVLRGLANVYEWLAPTDVGLDESVWRAVLLERETPGTRLAVWLYKVPAVVADSLLGALLVVWLNRRVDLRRAAAVGLVYVCIPAVVHNSAIWGQVDAIPTVLAVGSLEMARRGRIRSMAVFAALAVLTKAQAAMVAPIWAVAAVRWAGFDWRRWLWGVGIVSVVSLPVLLPFRGALGGVWDAYVGAAKYYPFTHLNGFSVWFLGNPLTTPHLGADLHPWYLGDNVPGVLRITPRGWGLAGVLCVGAFVTVVLSRRRLDDLSLGWAARLLPLAFFVLSTQMHERYLFPAIAIWAWTFTDSRRWWACWILLSLCVSVNVLWVWVGPGEGAFVTWCRQALHRPWLGLVPGIWCSIALAWLFAATLLKWPSGNTKTPIARDDDDMRKTAASVS